MSKLIDIGPATVEQVRPDLIIMRFKEGTVAAGKSFQISMEARKAHFSGTPHAVLLLSPEEADFDPAVLGADHYVGSTAASYTIAMALVCRNPTVRNILELYYAMHIPPFPARFFDDEGSAMEWLEVIMAEAKR